MIFCMTEKKQARAIAIVPLVISGLALSGCIGSPTYGTDKTANEQLVQDVTGVLSIGPKDKPKIDYRPRPELVKPSAGELRNLPAPQENIAASGNSAWPESPEQRLARIRAEATENQGNPNYQSEVVANVNAPAPGGRKPVGVSDREWERNRGAFNNSAQQREQFNARLAEQRQGSATTRKYLSEPPLTYREPSAGAPTGDVGEDELKKERRLKAEARKKGGGTSWRDFVPGL